MMLTMSNLCFSYDEKKMFENFSMSLKKGERVGLTGDSGCGKSTLIQLALGFLKPSGGRVYCTPNVSVDFQDNRLFENATVYENIACTHFLSKKSLEEVLLRFHLEGICDEKVRDLSGGMKRRVALVRALLYPADLYLLDESVREVEEKTRRAMLQGIRDFTRDRAVLYITHREEDIPRLQLDKQFQMERKEDGTIALKLV